MLFRSASSSACGNTTRSRLLLSNGSESTPASDYFCIEPVSHVSNAIQMGDPAAHGLVALEAGDTIEAWMTIEVAKP